MFSTILLPPRAQLCIRYCSNKQQQQQLTTKNPDLDILFGLYHLGTDAWTQTLTVDEALAAFSIVLRLLQGLSKPMLCVLLHHARDIRNVLQQAYRNKKNETHQHGIHVTVTAM